MRSYLLALAVWMGLSSSLIAQVEGGYQLNSTDACSGSQIDHVVIIKNSIGDYDAYFSSLRYGFLVEIHRLNWQSETVALGTTTNDSPGIGVSTLLFANSHNQIQVDLNSSTCVQPFQLSGQFLNANYDSGQLEPLETVPTLPDFAGTYTVATEERDGYLKLIYLRDRRLAGVYGNDIVQRLIVFDEARLDTLAQTLELFAYGTGSTIEVKWSLKYGRKAGTSAMEGYGLTIYGRAYPMNLIKQ